MLLGAGSPRFVTLLAAGSGEENQRSGQVQVLLSHGGTIEGISNKETREDKRECLQELVTLSFSLSHELDPHSSDQRLLHPW